MAANEYLRAAAAHLQTAVQAVRIQIDQMRADLMTSERQITHDIDSREAEIRAHSARLATPQDPAASAVLHAQIRNLQNDVSDRKKQLEQMRDRTNQAIKGKEGAINGLMNQAKGLQRQASDPSLQ